MFKTLVQDMEEKSRAVMFALKLYAENALLVGMICDLNGKAVSISDLVPLRFIDEAIEHKVLFSVGEFYVFSDWTSYFVRTLTLDEAERFRKANGMTKERFCEFLKDYTCGSDKFKGIVDYYGKSAAKPVTVAEIIESSSLLQSEKKLVYEYALRFGTRSQFDKGVIPTTAVVSEAITEIVGMVDNGYFYYSGKKHDINKVKLLAALERVISMKHVVHLKNNNYLKQPLMNVEAVILNSGTKAKTREGY